MENLRKFYTKSGLIILLILIIAFAAIRLIRYREAATVALPPVFENGTLEETGKMAESQSQRWWLNSGGLMTTENGVARTNFGDLPKDSSWRKLYAKTNARDTENGKQPQNIFRLVTRSEWQELTQQLYFNIEKINLSESEFRNESNGVLLFNRYQDGDNLYYTGIRMDGDVVIKKKIDGKYYTLAEKHLLTNGEKYDRIDNPNQLPLHAWFGLKSEVINIDKDTVGIKLFIDKEGNGNWQLALEAKDSSKKYGKAPLTDAGFAGIRTDFMDVSFRDYKIEENKK
jgi:hypothetical protein